MKLNQRVRVREPALLLLRKNVYQILLVAGVTVLASAAAPAVSVAIATVASPFDVLSDLPTHDATVGTMAGEARAEGGVATYTIPISLPPGRHGMAPSLSLNYSSRSGAGTAGLGWSLGGLSSLYRCPRTPEQDGETRAVKNDGSDRLCLDGQRLIAVNASTLVPIAGQTGYGANGSIYRTEVDTFVRVTQFGDTLSGANSCFKVETKSGVVRYYGGTASGNACTNNARVVPGGATAPLSWMLKQEVDPLGNTVNYTYASGDGSGAYGTGEVLLQGITYTGFGADPGDRSVTFVYESRPDVDRTSSYASGGLTRQTRRLAAIGTYDGAQRVRDYNLRYVQSNYSGRSVLQGVEECAYAVGASTPVCHPETVFGMADSQTSTEPERWPTELTPLYIPGVDAKSAQFDQATALSIQRPAHAGESLGLTGMRAIEGSVSYGPSTVRDLGDFDGNGARELGVIHYVNGTSTKAYLASVTVDRNIRGVIEASAGLGVQGGLGNQLVDVNGDGRTDIVMRRTVGGVRKLSVGIWAGVENGSWLPEGFQIYDTSVPLPSTSNSFGCEAISFADMNGDGRADLLLTVPSTMACGSSGSFPQQELRIYLGQAGADPRIPAFASTPVVTRALAQVNGSNNTKLQETVDVMDFNGDGLPDVVVSRPSDITEVTRFQKLWFGRNVNGTYTLGGTGQEITTFAALANPPLESDEIHKQAFTTWADVNGDGLQDFISVKIQNQAGYWSVRLNRGGILGPRIVTTSTRGLERCYDDSSATQPDNECINRWRAVFSSRFQTGDVDSDGRTDLLVPRAFAARLCVRRVSYVGGDPGDARYDYWCPENPATGAYEPLPPVQMLPSDKQYGMYAPGGDSSSTDQHGIYVDNLDPSAYFLDALRFIQTGDDSFTVEVTPTSIVQGQTVFDMFGDGLVDQVAYLGTPFAPSDANPRLESMALLEPMGPSTLPNGIAVTELETQRLTMVSENRGAVENPKDQVSHHVLTIPVLPELMTSATNGLGDRADWVNVPLGTGFIYPKSRPFYSIPDHERYVDSRHYYFASSMPVTYALYRSNGIGGNVGSRSQTFTYSEAMYNHQGRGFQGFRSTGSREEVSSDRQVVTRTVFHQKFPLAGKVESVTTSAGQWPYSKITEEVTDWRCTVGASQRQVCPGDGATPAAPQRDTVYFPYADRNLATTFDPSPPDENLIPITEIETVNAVDETVTTSGWDAYGNLRDQMVIRRDVGSGSYPDSGFVDEQRQATHRVYTSNTSTWFLDRLDSESVATEITYKPGHTPPSGVDPAARSVTTQYEWNDDRTPRKQVVQPGVAHQEATRVWCYRTTSTDCPSPTVGTNYGLPTSTVVRAPDAGADRRTAYVYSKNGTTVSADGYFVLNTTNPLSQVTTTEYRPRDGALGRTVKPSLVSAVTLFDAFDRPIKTEMRDTANALIEPPTQTALSKFEDGKCSNEVGAIGGEGEDYVNYCETTVKSGTPSTLSFYDGLGRLVKFAQRGFDGRFVITKTEFDERGLIARQSIPRYADATTERWQEHFYDVLGRSIGMVDQVNDLGPDISFRITYTTYSGRRTTTRIQDILVDSEVPCPVNTPCFETRTYNSVLGQVLYDVDAGEAVTRRWLDSGGGVVGIENSAGVLTRASYDARGRRVQSIDPDQGTWSFVTNGFDEFVSQIDGRGAVTTVDQRDGLGRIRRMVHAPPTSVPTGMTNEVLVDEWTYDPTNGAGQLDSIVRKRGSTAALATQVWKEQYGYEAATRRLSTITNTLEGESSWTSGVTYDADGREATRTYPSGLVVQTSYTDYGQARRLSNASTGAIYWTATANDARGNVIGETFGNGLSGTHVWAESTGQAKVLEWKNGGATVERFAYVYDVLGNLKTQQRGSVVESYNYDVRQRLVSAAVSGGATVGLAYSATGNLLSKSDFSTSAANAYTYGGSGCGPHGVSSVVRSTGTVTYQCDANGNVIGGSALTATFDAENRPRTFSRSASGTGGGNTPVDRIFRDGFEGPQNFVLRDGPTDGSMSYDYDSKGGRMVEVGIAGTTRYGPNGYEKRIPSGGATQHRHELGPVVVTRIGTTDTVSYVLRDRLGSTIAVSDASAALSERRQFDAFGKARNADFTDRPAGQANLTNTNHGFTGHTQADEVWLVHMNGRVYDQNLGRFLSVDPIVQSGGSQALNPYSYIQNNPLAGIDPSGYAALAEEGGCDPSQSTCGNGAPASEEIKPTQGAILTGSHIAGVNSGASITLVNPSASGMASLAVSLAGMKSGYVVQASAIERAANTIAADEGRGDSRGGRPQDRAGANEETANRSGAPSWMAALSTAALAQTSSGVTADQFLAADDVKQGQVFCSSGCEATPELAHEAAANRYLGATLVSQREVMWRVYEVSDGTFAFTFGRMGLYRVGGGALPTLDPKLKFHSSGHTHWDSNLLFSPQDWRLITQEKRSGPGMLVFLATRNGVLQYSTPENARKYSMQVGAANRPPVNDFPGTVVKGATIKTSYP